MTKTLGYEAKHSVSTLRPMFIERRAPAINEVEIEILYCGVCNSDVHQVLNEWKNTLYPCMPGHEIVGRVTVAGSDVSKYKVGDLVGVGCMVDSCHHCESCLAGLEQYCEEGFLAMYNGNQRTPSEENHTYGGYSEKIVVREDFVLRMPIHLDPAASAPLPCAGVTTYSPLRHWKVGNGTKVGVAGFGGLGQMALKLSVAMGATVTVLTTSDDKSDDALRLGASKVIQMEDKGELKASAASLDFILSTIPQPHDPNPYMPLLRRDGVYVVVGCIAPLKAPLDLSKMLIDRKSLGTSLIGGIAETQEVLDFCSEHNIVSECKIIPIDQLNDAFDQVNKGKVDFRFVIDMASIKGKQEDDGLMAKVAL